jgi:hypothetical protein
MRIVWTFALILVLAAATIAAQTKSGSKGAASKSAPVKKSSSENTCDGALDIVPSETLSFQRKRRPPTVRQPAAETAGKKTEK